MLFKVLKHFKTEIKGVGVFALGIGIGHILDNSYVRFALWVGLVALTINAVIGFIELKKKDES